MKVTSLLAGHFVPGTRSHRGVCPCGAGLRPASAHLLILVARHLCPFARAGTEYGRSGNGCRCLDRHVAGLLGSMPRQSMAAKSTGHRTGIPRLFLGSSDAVMTLAPPAWKFTSCNPATVRIFGVKDEAEFTAMGVCNVSPEMQPDGQISSEKAMIEAAMRDGSCFFEWTHIRASGQAFPATVLLTRTEVAGQAVLQATVRDITAQKRAEEMIRLDESRANILLELSQMTDRSAAEIANHAMECAIA